MSKLLKITLLLYLFVDCSIAFANVECPAAKINLIKQQEEMAFIQLEGQNWHVIARKTEPLYKQLLQKALAAKQKEAVVSLVFSSGYDASCMISNYDYSLLDIKVIEENGY